MKLGRMILDVILLIIAFMISSAFTTGQWAVPIGEVGAIPLLFAAAIYAIAKRFLGGGGRKGLITTVFLAMGEAAVILLLAGFIDAYIGFPIISIVIAGLIIKWIETKV